MLNAESTLRLRDNGPFLGTPASTGRTLFATRDPPNTRSSALCVHVRPARSIFSNALNFCRSAIAALVRSIVVAHRTLPDDLVYGIAEAVFANPDEMMQVHNAAADTVPTNFTRNTILPFHDGAARWYHNKSTSGVVHGD